jgi:signal transduction histidine kinase/ActR/RegA family two-component response regulator
MYMMFNVMDISFDTEITIKILKTSQRMNKIVTILFFFIAFQIYSQENIDSLISSWNKLSEDFIVINEMDSACKYGNCAIEMMDQKIVDDINILTEHDLRNLKIKKAAALSNLVTAYGNSDKIELAKECYLSALDIYEEIGDIGEIYNLNIRMGRVMDLRSSYKEAIKYYQKANGQAVLIDDKKGQALCYYYIGLNNRYMGNYSEALKYHLRDLQIQEDLNNKLGIANAYITIAAILNTLKDRDAAMEKLFAAKKLFEEIQDTTGIATVYNDLGSTFLVMGDTSEALQNHLQAAKLRELSSEFNGLGASNSYISRIYQEQGEPKKALNYLKAADKAFKNSSNLHGIMTTQIEMSDFYLGCNDIDSALIWLDIAEESAKEIMNYFGLIKIYSSRGIIRMNQKNYSQAIKDFKYALSLAELKKNHQQIYQINALLSQAYKEIGNYENAYFYQSRSIQYKDSVDSNAGLNVAVQMEMEYNYKREKIRSELLQVQKDKLNEAKLAEQNTEKQLYFAGVLMFIIVSLGLWSRLRFIRKAGRELLMRKEEADRQRLIAETEKLKATKSEKVKEEFLANMSHEIRTPMNAIKGMIDILIRDEHPARQDKYLQAIRQSSENLLVILNEILDLSKLEAGKIEPEKVRFETENVLQNVQNILRFKAEEKGLKLILKMDDRIPKYLCGDQTHLHQILLNLASNAVKFTEKGHVTIESELKSIEGKKIDVQFKVTDTGIGIAKEKLDSVFEVFTQAEANTTRKYGGTGLGLTICKRLVELHNGQISVESELTLGSTFTVILPFEASDEPETKIIEEEQFVMINDLKILLAEDNQFNVMVAKDVIENSIPGAKVEVAENGKIALEKVQQNNYNLILMDIQMPEMDGYDTTKAIRNLDNPKSSIPIMAMTANVMKAEVDRCFEAGMNAYIGKPFERKELISNINKLLTVSVQV